MAERGRVLVIDASPTPWRAWIADVINHGPLLGALAQKDFQTRYKRASFGILWAVALPALQAGVMAVVLGRAANFDASGNYAAYVLSGMFAWTYFASTVAAATTAVVDGASLADKVWFPRAVLSLVPVLANGMGFLISLGVLAVLLPIVGDWPGWHLLLLAPATVLLLALTSGLSLMLSALFVYFRDARYLVQATLVVALYATPVIYPAHLLGSWAGWLDVNPATGVVELFHSAALGSAIPGRSLLVSVAASVVLLVTSAVVHRRHDRLFVDQL